MAVVHWVWAVVWELAEGGTKKQSGWSHVGACQEEWGYGEGMALGLWSSVEAEEEGDLEREWASGYWIGGEVGLQAGRDSWLGFGFGPVQRRVWL